MEFLNRISEAFDDGNDKVAFITATGTGKSYVSGAYIQQEIQLKGKRVLIISPRRSLNDEWENLLKDMDKIDYITYQKFYRYTSDDMNAIVNDYSLIIFDEIHHLGAKIWGKAALKLFDKAKESTHRVKFLGLSADPTRYDLDIDIADEMFDSKVIGYTIGEAIEAGILPKFEYRVVTYKLQENIEKLKKELKGRKRLRAEDPVHLLIDKLDKESVTYSVEKIVKSGLPKIKHNKLIVFVDHINKIGEEIHNFESMFPGSSIYQVHSKQSISANQIQIREFDDSDSELSFLFSVGMLNEGIHLANITGIIMLRRTESPTLYMQQLGRVMSSNKKVNPVVFDFVSNYSLIGRFELPTPEMEDPLTKRKAYNKSNFDVFQTIIDSKTMSIIELCQKIENLRNNNWDKEEDNILIENKNIPSNIIQRDLLQYKSLDSIRKRRRLLGVVYEQRWLEEDDIIIKYNRDIGISYRNIQEQYFPDKTLATVINRGIQIGAKCRNKKLTEEHKNIIEKYKNLSPKKIHDLYLPDIPESSIAKYKTKIHRIMHQWTKEDSKILMDNADMPIKQLQELYFPNRSIGAIRSHKSEISAIAQLRWTKEEIDIIAQHPDLSPKEIRDLYLPNRSVGSIRKHRRDINKVG